MRQVMKTFLLIMAAVLGWLPASWAYSPVGPVGNGGDAWQGPSTGFGPARDTVAPKNLGEEYRRNVPTLYYACDNNFANYFGTSGEQAVDNAFAVLNKAFTNNPTGQQTGLDGYSATLSEFPLQSVHFNYQAQAFGLFDMKSMILAEMMEQLGLADPTFYVFGIHNWDHVGPVGCPVGQEYDVVMRNFDYKSSPLSASQYNNYQYSPYINDVLYTYSIIELCAAPPTPWRLALPATVDPLADAFTPLAAQAHIADYGAYYNGLTRDDAAGLRHLMSAANVKLESISPDSVQNLISTNTDANAPFVFPPYLTAANPLNGTNGGYYVVNGAANGSFIGYGDLVAFLAFAKTNSPAVLQAAYPGVVISSVTVTGMVVQSANLVSYFTNAPVGSPFGSPPVLVTVTNFTPVFEFLYNYTFANVFTNHFVSTPQLLVSLTVGTPVGAPVGSPGATNLSVKTLPGNSGDFFVLPLFHTYTNVCPVDILPWGTVTNVLAITNIVGAALTNTSTTNFQSLTYTVNYFTNYSYVMDPVSCTQVPGTTGYYEGIEKLQFVKLPPTNYDSLLGRFTTPFTNYYTLNSVNPTNGQVEVQYIERVITRPDFLMSALDLTPGPNSPIFQIFEQVTQPPFITANVPAGLAGPGTIASLGPETITFNKDGPVFFNSFATTLNGNSYFVQPDLDQIGQPAFDAFYTFYFLYASYDGSTNAPIIYPNGTSIDNLQNQILVNVSPGTVPNGTNGVFYSPVTFTATTTYFVTPFAWSASGLPPGLYLNSNGDNTATLLGTPTQSGYYTFTVTLTDGLSRSVQWSYTITIQ
jgi:hypothetical protein